MSTGGRKASGRHCRAISGKRPLVSRAVAGERSIGPARARLSQRQSRARSTLAGRAASGRSAKARPASRLARAPPATIPTADTGSKRKRPSITKVVTAQPPAAPAAIATIPAARPISAARRAKLHRMRPRVAPSVLSTAASNTRRRSPAAAAPISTTTPVSSVAAAPQRVAAEIAPSDSAKRSIASRTRTAVMLGQVPATSRSSGASAAASA